MLFACRNHREKSGGKECLIYGKSDIQPEHDGSHIPDDGSGICAA